MRNSIRLFFLMTPRSVPRGTVPLFIGATLLLHLLAGVASAQTMQKLDQETKATYQARPGEALVLISVFAENGRSHLDRQAILKMTNETTKDVIWQTTDDNSEAGVGLLFGKYEIEVSAVGYL